LRVFVGANAFFSGTSDGAISAGGADGAGEDGVDEAVGEVGFSSAAGGAVGIGGMAATALSLISLSDGREGGFGPANFSRLGRELAVLLTFAIAPCKLPNALEIDAEILSARL
jgi:hypothetical protein